MRTWRGSAQRAHPSVATASRKRCPVQPGGQRLNDRTVGNFVGLNPLSRVSAETHHAPGLQSLWLHRLRSLLTVLGIVFGVCSVIAMLAIGEGASYEAQEQIKNLGSQNIILRSVKPPGRTKGFRQRQPELCLAIRVDLRGHKRIRATIRE